MQDEGGILEFEIEDVKIRPIGDNYSAIKYNTMTTTQVVYNKLSWAEFLSIALNDELLKSAESEHLPEETGRFVFECEFPSGYKTVIVVHDYAGGNLCLINSPDEDAIMEFIEWLDEYVEGKSGIDFTRSFTYKGETHTIVYQDGDLKTCQIPAWLKSLGL